ncbi:MAG TPA: ATP-binding protein, partial [Candidatus Baltobacteraceae bacterium]|nr:ATP-binding protein [Candidatus Baltobacteraceae bacterium]
TLSHLAELAGTLSRKYGKQVAIEVDEFDLRGLPDQQRRAVRDVLIQLTRNAVVHGIESPDDRSLGGKPKHGTILIQKIGSDPNSFGFLFHDDGRGIDPRRIKARAVSAGILTNAEAEAISDETALGALFQPGFTTTDEVTNDAGRGIGLYAVKSSVIDELGGEIVVQSEIGRYTSFSFSVPLANTAVSAAR